MPEAKYQCNHVASLLHLSIQKFIDQCEKIIEFLERISNYKQQTPVNYVELEQLMYHCQNALDDARKECVAIEQKYRDIQGQNLEIEELVYQICQYTFMFKEIIDNNRDMYQDVDIQLFDIRQFRQFREKLKIYEYSAI